jgi:hypothetical protein
MPAIHAVVVALDEREGGGRVGELPVQVDDRDTGVGRLSRDRRELCAVVGQHDDRVRLLLYERLDRGDLGRRVLAGVDGDQLHVAVLGGLRLGVVGDRGDPAVVGGRRGEPDGDGLAGLGVVAARHLGLSAVVVLGLVGGAAGEQDAGPEGGSAEQQSAAGSGHGVPPGGCKGPGGPHSRGSPMGEVRIR